MRVGQYLTERRIGIVTLNNLFEFVKIDQLKVTSKLTQERIRILDDALNSKLFEDWLQLRLSLDKIEIAEAKKIVKPLFLGSITAIDELLSEQILNALLFLIKKSFYPKDRDNLLQILRLDKSVAEKILLLRKSDTFNRSENTVDMSNVIKTNYNSNESNYDPYENFHWGDLSGEEAYTAYWNTE